MHCRILFIKEMKHILTIFLFILSIIEMAAQCPMCKASVESSRKTGLKSVGQGLNNGILLLLAAVYIVVMVVGIVWYRYYKQNRLYNAQ